jgi:hypothetical protein
VQLIAPRKLRRTATTGCLLVAFGLRALIAPGFMPAGGQHFLIEICPEGLPSELLSQGAQGPMSGMDDTMPGMDDTMPGMDGAMPDMDGSTPAPTPQGGGHSHMEHCWFGSACASAPPLQHPPCAVSPPAVTAAAMRLGAAAFIVRLVYLPHSRGPPVIT